MNRFYTCAALGAGLLLAGCGSNTQVGTIQITPASQSLAAGQTAQFTATGIISHGKHPSSNTDVTSQVTWASNAPAIATISSSGVATAVSAGTATITASMPGAVSATASVTVSGGGTVTTNSNVVKLSIIPGSQSVASPSETSQFLAIGTNASGATIDLTSAVAWSSSATSIATISSAGLATGAGQGSATITAIATNPDKTVATGSATFTVAAGASEPITALTITPAAETLSASGQTGQFIAIGTSGVSGLTQDVTNSPQMKWISSIPSVASITSGQSSGNGVAKGSSAGSTTISAVWTNPDGTVVSAPPATVTVTLSAAPEPLLSLTIIPSSITVGNLQGTGNFLAIGTFSTPPTVRDLTSQVQWISSTPNVFPVNNAGQGTGSTGGIVTAYGNGAAVIVAEATDPLTGSIQTATATFSCPLVLPNPPTTAGSCYEGSQAQNLLATVTVYNEGLGDPNWLVTAPSATGTPNVIHCGPGSVAAGLGSPVCVATYPIGASVTLTVPGNAGAPFGGWSTSCNQINPNPSTASGANTCTINGLTTNETVGVIFN